MIADILRYNIEPKMINECDDNDTIVSQSIYLSPSDFIILSFLLYVSVFCSIRNCQLPFSVCPRL